VKEYYPSHFGFFWWERSLEKQKPITGKELFKGIAYIVCVFVALYALNSYIEKKIEDQIQNPKFIDKLANKIMMPFIIFDENERILSTSTPGIYEEYIKKIAVEKDNNGEIVAITIFPKKFLQVAPIIESLDAPLEFAKAIPVNQIDWKYRIKQKNYLCFKVKSENPGEITERRFRITIIR